uniref:Hormone-sensitive lipase n=1 Tax=Strix occidentalis caurina TaxID=311401 RepID=A0A8D0FUJ8_STROC
MDARPLFQSLQALADDNASFFQRSGTESGRRFAAAFAALREHGRRLEPALRHFARLYHRFDLDEATPGNGYRSLVQTACCCLAHAVHKSRYVAAHRRSVFFRAGHNVAELEAYCAALAQLRALLCLAQRLLAQNRPGCLFPPEEDGLSELVLREYSTMHNGCFYGRCLGFQFAPSIRPFLQTIAIGLVSFGENYKRNDMGLGVAAGSLFTSGKFAIDPELRGDEFERLTQNLDVHFWKSFWNLTETELLASVASMTATQVGVCRALTVPPEPLELPLAADPSVTVTIAPPVAHTGPGPVHMRLLSYQLREGQDSAALSALTRTEGPRAPLRWWRGPPLPPSPALLVHFHGGGFVAQTSRSHEPYLRGWARELGAPILSVDYALAPEAPFPRALEECFYAYCWALRNCRLLGSTAQRVCLAGDSAGGNLCLTVSMRAAAVGVQAPDGIMAAYPVTLVQAAVSPSRLLTLLDPLLPLGVLCKCLSAYAGGGTGEMGGMRRIACALDPMLDDSVALARRLRALGRPVTLQVVPDLPHGFLSLGPLSPETRQATAICTRLIRDILQPPSAPPDGPRRGSLLLGPRRDSLAPQDGLRRGSLLAGPRRDSLAPQDSPRRGSVLSGSRRDSLAPQDSPHRGSLLLGARRDSPAPQDSPRRGSLLLGPRRDSLAPQDSPRRGSLLLGGRRESLVTHGVGAINLGSPAAATHSVGGTSTHGSATAPTHGGSAPPVTSPSTALTHGTRVEGDGAAPTHGTSTIPTHGTGVEGDGAAPTHGTGATLTHSTSAAPTHGTGATLTHSSGTTLTHSTRAGLTHGDGTALTHTDSTALTHGAALNHGTTALPPHGTGAPPPHGAGSLPGPEADDHPRRPSAHPPPCCGALTEGGAPSPPDPGAPRPPPGRGRSAAQPLARRPSGPAGREVGS